MFDGLFQPMHLIVILFIALMVFGPKKLPELGKGLGEGLKGFKEGIRGVTDPAPPVQQTSVTPPPVPPTTSQVETKQGS